MAFFKILKLKFSFFQLLQDRADKICEMALVMQKSVQIDEENQAREQELMSRLITENKVTKMFVCMFVLCKKM
jgi:hypothetical protein